MKTKTQTKIRLNENEAQALIDFIAYARLYPQDVGTYDHICKMFLFQLRANQKLQANQSVEASEAELWALQAISEKLINSGHVDTWIEEAKQVCDYNIYHINQITS